MPPLKKTFDNQNTAGETVYLARWVVRWNRVKVWDRDAGIEGVNWNNTFYIYIYKKYDGNGISRVHKT